MSKFANVVFALFPKVEIKWFHTVDTVLADFTKAVDRLAVIAKTAKARSAAAQVEVDLHTATAAKADGVAAKITALIS